ncbi:hypothetical protein J4E08_17920 [Sagittula sp. NFXS13]|uniref:hypothetical protein n=1 Tax=Sagittula sp. NFXS13 TaxID=2819095 RepID=UPI0032DF3829
MENSSLKQREDELFQRWPRTGSGFVTDGATDANSYESAECKVAFILKEPNGENGSWDMRSFAADGARAHTWNNIVRWSRVLKNLATDISWSGLEAVSKTDRMRELRSIVMMNLKKEPGGAVTDRVLLHSAASVDKLLLREQYELYEPNFTIFGGSGWLAKAALFDGEMKWHMGRRGIPFALTSTGDVIIDFWHPNARYPAYLLAYALVDVAREAIAERQHLQSCSATSNT